MSVLKSLAETFRVIAFVFVIVYAPFCYSHTYEEFIQSEESQEVLKTLKSKNQRLFEATSRDLQRFSNHYSALQGFDKDHFYRKLSEAEKIPKVFHFIWVGNKYFPLKSISNLKSVLEHHKDYTIYFWTDRDRSKDFVCLERGYYDRIVFKDIRSVLTNPRANRLFQQSHNFAEKSDILRYFILYDMGGIYVDHDIYAVKNFDLLVNHLTFFCYTEPLFPMVEEQYLKFSNSLIGCNKQNRILKKVIDEVDEHWDYWERVFQRINISLSDPGMVTVEENPELYRLSVFLKTYIPFTKTIKSFELSETECIFPPQHFLYCPDSKIQPYSLHFFEGSWL